MITEFGKKFTPEDEELVYSQILSLPIHLKENLIVLKALFHKKGISSVLLFSKYATTIFAQSKTIRKLNPPVVLIEINSLIADDHTNRIHPVGTLSDAAHYLAAKSIFEWSQAIHCLKMGNQKSLKIRANNLANRKFA